MNYQKIYNQIVSKAKFEKRVKTKDGIYYELHHIIPRCLGGMNIKENLVYLTGKEHYLCHKLLTFIFPLNEAIFYSFWRMCTPSQNGRFKPSARIYEIARKEFSLRHSKNLAGHIVTQSTRDKISAKHKGRKRGYKTTIPKEQRLKISSSLMGHAVSEKVRERGGCNSKKVVYQYDLYGNFIQEWESITKAALKVNGNATNVSRCCKGERPTAYGFIWKFEKQNFMSNKEIEEFIVEWHAMFPLGKHVSTDGYLRGTYRDCVKKMQSFCKNNKQFTKDIIFAATKMYLATKQSVGYAYLSRPYYFITKNNISMLGDYCQRIVDGDVVEIKPEYEPINEFL